MRPIERLPGIVMLRGTRGLRISRRHLRRLSRKLYRSRRGGSNAKIAALNVSLIANRCNSSFPSGTYRRLLKLVPTSCRYSCVLAEMHLRVPLTLSQSLSRIFPAERKTVTLLFGAELAVFLITTNMLRARPCPLLWDLDFLFGRAYSCSA